MPDADPILTEHRRRLAVLELRIARLGTSAPPEWVTEAEAIRVTIARLRLQRALRRAHVPPPPQERVIDWSAVWARGRAFLVAFGVLLLFLLVFSFVR